VVFQGTSGTDLGRSHTYRAIRRDFCCSLNLAGMQETKCWVWYFKVQRMISEMKHCGLLEDLHCLVAVSQREYQYKTL
jgi:hypothetical protein